MLQSSFRSRENVPTILFRWMAVTTFLGMLCAVCWGCTPESKLPSKPTAARSGKVPSTLGPAPEQQRELSQDGPLDGADGRELLLRNFTPTPQLRVKQTELTQAKFPVVDVHTHFRHRTEHDPEFLEKFVAVMDRNQIAVCVSLDGKLGDDLQDHLDYLWTDYKNRFVVFANIDWQGDGQVDQPETWAWLRDDFVRHTVEQLREARRMGVSGLKLFKQFGLGYRDAQGELMKIDDPRWDPIWETCGELGLPVLIHTADPAAFFEPIDATNERWEELSRHPDWSFFGDQFPSRRALLEARNRVIERHPQTTFIAAHMANNAEDLAQVSAWLDKYPNMVVEFASRIGELGRQPYTARDFLIKYQDRVLFGTDGPWPETRILLYWRFLETFDEYFPYSEKPFPPQGFWRIYGVGLPDEVLHKIYADNASRWVPGVAERLEAYRQSRP